MSPMSASFTTSAIHTKRQTSTACLISGALARHRALVIWEERGGLEFVAAETLAPVFGAGHAEALFGTVVYAVCVADFAGVGEEDAV